jgi:aryl carrier-like protein
MPETPGGQPPSFKVEPLLFPAQLAEKRNGRPRKRKMPPLPQEILDGMSELEQEHYTYFIESYQAQYPDLTDADQIALVQAGLEYINTLRVQAKQLKTGEVISMARQHPGVQLRAWLDLLSVTRKQRKPNDKQEEAELKNWFTGLSKGS